MSIFLVGQEFAAQCQFDAVTLRVGLALDVDVADRVVAQLTDIAAIGTGDAT